MYDAAWSPINCSLFASVDGSGKLDLWNLISNTELPIASMHVNNGMSALNKLKWSKCGTKIALGDDQGKITLVDINDSISKSKSPSDDAKSLKCVLNDLKQNSIDLQEIKGISRSLSELISTASI